MGEESTSPVYIGKYDDGKVVFEPLGEFKVIDHDITDVYPDDMVRTITRDQTITVKAFLQKKGLRGFYKAIGMPAYLRTEYLFPKKKKRGTARRKRRIDKEVEKAKKKFIEFINDKYGSPLIGTQATRTIIDEYIISKDELPAFAGPFEGEEE